MIELDTEADPLTPTVSLEDAATFADGVGPSKALLISADGDDTGFVTRAHALGLAVHPWTFRDDVPVSEDMDIDAELQRIYALGVDGVFTDFPATAVQVRDAMSDG
jgi:glycerophosphoryl diester phosphodiesterase